MKSKSRYQVNWKTILMVGSAYASYNIGAGFATGQEILQFFGAYGSNHVYLGVLVSMGLTFYFTASCYMAGQSEKFHQASDCYEYYCGKHAGRFFDGFVLLFILGILVVMFAGSGVMAENFFDVSPITGEIIMGVISGIVVLAGLKNIKQVLGITGIILVLYLVLTGVYAIATKGFDLELATENLQEYINQGVVLQAGIFGVSHWFLSAVSYSGFCLIISIPLLISLGQSTRNQQEAFSAGIFSSLFFHGAILLVSFAILLNLDEVVKIGIQIPTFSAIQNMIPGISWSFGFILMIGIFTSIIGYLWMLSERFTKEGSLQSKGLIVLLILFGVMGGTLFPFNKLVNLLYPFAGLMGILFMMFILLKDMKKNI